jgi:hypothetical protein
MNHSQACTFGDKPLQSVYIPMTIQMGDDRYNQSDQENGSAKDLRKQALLQILVVYCSRFAAEMDLQ